MEKNKKVSKELLKKIERIPEFEDKLGIVYDNITVKVDLEDYEIFIFADIMVVDEEKFNKNRSIITKVTLYDNENYILDMYQDIFNVSDFLGLETFQIYNKYHPDYDIEEIEKIRILPK